MFRCLFPAVIRISCWASFGLAGVLFAGQTEAAVPVEDMSTRDVRPAAPAVPTELPAAGVGATPPGRNAQLFYELQVLQTEVQQLRGLVEDQAYEIKRLRDLQRSQYLDIDRRLTEDGRSVSRLPQNTSAEPELAQTQPLQTNPVARAPQGPRESVPVVQTGSGSGLSTGTRRPTPVVESANTAPVNDNPEQSLGRVETPAEVAIAPSEQAAFDRAFELMKDQQFEQSIAAYQNVVERFPDGNYAPQSRYWLGELYLMSDRLEAARGAFTAVVEAYPAHQKVPLSLYKLGVVNHRLGATPAALEYLDNVVTRYPDTPAAGLARTYAAELR